MHDAFASAVSSGPVPRLPALARLPLRLVPAAVHQRLACAVLNQLMQRELAAGRLDFFAGRTLSVRADELGVELRLGMQGRRFTPLPAGTAVDLRIEGPLHSFLLLAARRCDPDTLFFQRRLMISGDTELSLAIKNFLDSLEDNRLVELASALAGRLVDLAERLRF